jgi:hypothetical protein
MDDIDFNALGQALDTSWGRSSTPKTASYSVKSKIQGSNQLLVTYQTVINFRTQVELLKAKHRFVEESVSITNDALKQTKSLYKEITGSALKAKELSSTDSIEMVSPRMAVYRRKTIVEVS